ncbi:MAG: hypothetical protein ABW004_00295 [Aeromicrobium sp.]
MHDVYSLAALTYELLGHPHSLGATREQAAAGSRPRGVRRLRRDVPVAAVAILSVLAFAFAAAAVLLWP